jgi:hypothetical protein
MMIIESKLVNIRSRQLIHECEHGALLCFILMCREGKTDGHRLPDFITEPLNQPLLKSGTVRIAPVIGVDKNEIGVAVQVLS